MSEPNEGIARPQPFIVMSAPDASRAMTTPRMSTALPSSSSQAATWTISSPGDVGDGVEHVGASVE